MGKKKKGKSKETSIREQIAHGPGGKLYLGRTSARVIDLNNPPIDTVGIPISARRVKPLKVKGRLEDNKPRDSMILPSRRKKKTAKDFRAEAKSLANHLGKKPFRKWSSAEVELAKKILGKEGIDIIKDHQDRQKEKNARRRALGKM